MAAGTINAAMPGGITVQNILRIYLRRTRMAGNAGWLIDPGNSPVLDRAGYISQIAVAGNTITIDRCMGNAPGALGYGTGMAIITRRLR